MDQFASQNSFRMLVIGSVSGICSCGSIFLIPNGVFWIPGLIFGIFISLPLSRFFNHRVLRIVGFAVSSTIAYAIAFFIQAIFGNSGAISYMLSCAVAGFVGSFLVGAGVFLLFNSKDARLFRLLIASGTIMGAFFGSLIVFMPGDNLAYPLKLAIGFSSWQGVTAFPLGITSSARKGAVQDF